MNLQVKTYLNDGPGRFFGYEPGDALTAGPVLTVAISDDDDVVLPITEHQAAEAAWVVGNREGVDVDGQSWPSNVRSLSVGDVVIIGETALSCEGIGWMPVAAFPLAVSLDPLFAKVNTRGRHSVG